MTESATKKALWTPGWYELDQTLVLGERRKFWFFQQPPTELLQADDSIELVFYNQLDSSSNFVVRYAHIVDMHHAELGRLMRIDTDGLDYIFFPMEGEEVVVNAEEEPGKIYNSEMSVDDWTVVVQLTEVSQPMASVT